MNILACSNCGEQGLECIKAADVYGVSGGVIKYIILCNHCSNNFPWCSSPMSEHGSVIYTRQLAVSFISNDMDYTAYFNVFIILNMKPLTSQTFDHIKTQWYDACITLKEKTEAQNHM
jgi:hypothetical protein